MKKYNGKYSLSNRLLREMAAKPPGAGWVEWGAKTASGEPVPEKFKVWWNKTTRQVMHADGTVVSGCEGKVWADMSEADAWASMRGYARAQGGYDKQDWTSEVHGAESGKKGHGDDMDFGGGKKGESKGMSGRELSAPILVGDTVDASNMVQHAKNYLAGKGGTIYSGSSAFTEADFDFTKASISGYGEGGKKAVRVPLKN